VVTLKTFLLSSGELPKSGITNSSPPMIIVTGFFTSTGRLVLSLGLWDVTLVVVVVTFGLVVACSRFGTFLMFSSVFLLTGSTRFLGAGLFLFLLWSILILLPLCLLLVVYSWPAGWEVGEVLVLLLLPASFSLGGTKTRVLSLPPSSLKV